VVVVVVVGGAVVVVVGGAVVVVVVGGAVVVVVVVLVVVVLLCTVNVTVAEAPLTVAVRGVEPVEAVEGTVKAAEKSPFDVVLKLATWFVPNVRVPGLPRLKPPPVPLTYAPLGPLEGLAESLAAAAALWMTPGIMSRVIRQAIAPAKRRVAPFLNRRHCRSTGVLLVVEGPLADRSPIR
jgi:hypothetical protein